jgi:hypothetical protein
MEQVREPYSQDLKKERNNYKLGNFCGDIEEKL